MRKRHVSLGIVLSLFSMAFVACTREGSSPLNSQVNEAWNRSNSPDLMGSEFELAFSRLPRTGKLDAVPWTDSYWPLDHGGISQRWNDPRFTTKESHFQYTPHSLSEVQEMSIEERMKLSPAEKYDLFVGDLSYPTVALERKLTSPEKEKWEGRCAGWAPASLIFAEPRPVTLISANGVEIPFGSSDVKALLTYYYDSSAPAKPSTVASTTYFLGDRCYVDFSKDQSGVKQTSCRDTNAGAFHVALTNLIGMRKTGLVIDQTHDAEVWNQPVHTYSSRVLGLRGPSVGASPRATREVIIETKVVFTVEVEPNWFALAGTSGHANKSKTYRYSLELDERGMIIGGEWLGEDNMRSYFADRPDFMWRDEPLEFEGYYSQIEQIYKNSVQ